MGINQLEIRTIGNSMTQVVETKPFIGKRIIAQFYGGVCDAGERNAKLFLDAWNRRENLMENIFSDNKTQSKGVENGK